VQHVGYYSSWIWQVWLWMKMSGGVNWNDQFWRRIYDSDIALSLSLSFSGRFAFHDGRTRQLVSNIVWQTHKAHSFVRLSRPRDHLTLRRRLSLYTHIAAGCVRSHLVSRRTRKPCCRKETKPCHVLSTSPLFHLEFREDPLIPVEQISAALMPHGR